MKENNFNFTNGVSYDVWYEQKRLIEQLKNEHEELKEKYKWYDHYKESALLNKDLCNKASLERDRYRKALDKIEEYVRDNSDFDKSDTLTSKTGAYDILDIINNAKER